jgi:hypothetical protein
MLTYTDLDGEVLDLSTLSDAERIFFERVLALYRADAPYNHVRELISGEDNPILEPGCRITAAVAAHPLWRALRDLEDRLGIKQGYIGAMEGDDPDRDPVADEWLSTTEAAAAKGVTVVGLHKAIARGDVVAGPAKPGGVRRIVSRNSLDRWTPNPVRQAARRKAATRA